MHPELFLLIGISISMGFTPGPNNAVASYSAFNFGFRKTLPIILGVGFGYTTLVILLILVLISVFQEYPLIQEIIRILGSIFLIYLAYKISFSNGKSDGKIENPVKFYETFFFQFINPKGVMAAITLISKFVIQDEQDLEEVEMAREEYKKFGVEADIYLMAVGATVEGQAKTSKQVADLALQNGYKYSPRLHVDLFGNKWGT